MRRAPLFLIVGASIVIGCVLVTGPCEVDREHQRVRCEKEGAAAVVAPARSIEAAGKAASDIQHDKRIEP